jgi:hypothetical protein
MFAVGQHPLQILPIFRSSATSSEHPRAIRATDAEGRSCILACPKGQRASQLILSGSTSIQSERQIVKPIIGKDVDGIAKTEGEHFGNRPVCGALLDMRDLAQVLAHVHEQEIEIIEGDPKLASEGQVH